MKDEIISTAQKFEEWKTSRTQRFSKYSLKLDDLISLKYDVKPVEELIKIQSANISESNVLLAKESNITLDGAEKSIIFQLDQLVITKIALEGELEKPFKDWQEFQKQLKDWEAKRKDILGNDQLEGSIKFYERELKYLNEQINKDLEENRHARNNIVREIYALKQQIQSIYQKMKVAVSEILKEYSEGQDISIETSFKVDKSFYIRFFDYVNRYGDFHSTGDEVLKQLINKYDFDNIEDIVNYINDLFSKDTRIKESRTIDFYDFICSLDYIHPEYDLRLNDKSLNQLSPGEKGGLLLVFYLVLDKDNKPLIIDQPEDNLDNQSVAEILVPYIKSAKKKRQIIMVTHNPNLAIVADAEQIIYMNIDKENNYIVSSFAGGIEDPIINKHIVDILEGKMKAFDNRRIKYKKN